jgi:hypothetical protein
MSFYIYLPSNSNAEFSPSNTCANFTVFFNPAIVLNGDYEIGLSEIQHPAMVISDKKKKMSTIESGDTPEAEIKIKNVEHPNTMMIYCSMIRATIVGNSKVPLLRAVSTQYTNSKRESNTSIVFSNPYYHPVSSNYISQAEVSIKTHSGENFPFPDGISLLCLHLRPKK